MQNEISFSRDCSRVTLPCPLPCPDALPFSPRARFSLPSCARIQLLLVLLSVLYFPLFAHRTVKFQKPLVKREKICYNTSRKTYRGVVQLVESRSPKPLVLGSSPSAPAKKKADCESNLLFSVKSADGGRNPPLVDEIASR